MVTTETIAKAVETLRPILEQVVTPERGLSDQRLFDRFQMMFSPENIDSLTEQNFRDFTSFKMNEHWSGIHRQNGAILKDFKGVKAALKHILDEAVPVKDRFNRVREGALKVDRLGSSILSSVLITVFPDRYCVYNTKVRKAFKKLGLAKSLKTAGERYEHYLDTCTKLKNELDCSFLDLDFCWHLIFEQQNTSEIQVFKLSPGAKGFDWENQHDSGVAAIGWNGCGPLSDYEKMEDAVKVCMEKGETNSASYLLQQFRNIYVSDPGKARVL